MVYIRLEDLVSDTANTLQQLESFLERKPGSDLKRIIEGVSPVPSKSHNAHGAAWREKNQLQHLTASTSRSDLEFVTGQLDHKLMKKFGYPLLWFPPEVS